MGIERYLERHKLQTYVILSQSRHEALSLTQSHGCRHILLQHTCVIARSADGRDSANVFRLECLLQRCFSA